MSFNNLKSYLIGYVILAIVIFFLGNFLIGKFVDLFPQLNFNNEPVTDSFLKTDFKLLAGASLIFALAAFLPKALKK